MMSDKALRDNVLAELDFDPRVDAAHIGVAVHDGIVTLSGHVPSYAEKSEAERAVRRVAGVRGIAEEIQIRLDGHAKTPDEDIAERVANVLKWDAALPHDAISVKAENGVVTLRGEVPWEFQRSQAQFDVARLKGITHLVNQIAVKALAQPQEVIAKIEAAFQRQASLDATGITVAADGRTVTLIGKVSSWRERELAERAAWSIPGVQIVEDRITVSV